LGKFHGLLRRMYIVQMLDEIFCRHQLGPLDLWCDLVLKFLYWFFVWNTYLLVIRGIKVSHYHYGSICAFRSFRRGLMKLGALTFGSYRLIIIISFWCISPFIGMYCPSFSHSINVNLKTNLSDISIATLACFGGHWLGKSFSSLSPDASVCFCQWDGSPVNNRLLDLPF
jgi:hypothetical protein